MHDRDKLTILDLFSYFDSCLMTYDNRVQELSIQRTLDCSTCGANLMFHPAAVHSVLSYSCKVFNLSYENNLRCLHSVARNGWSNQIGSLQVRDRILGMGSNSISPQPSRPSRLIWLGHALCMPFVLSGPHFRPTHGMEEAEWK